MNNKTKNILAVCLSVILTAFAVWALGRLVQPKYTTGVLEGGMVREYYDEEHPHDVIFIGDCEVYENFVPVTLWQEYGITSYIRGSAEQLIWQSYWLLKETFSREDPKVVVFNVMAMQSGEPTSEAYNRMTLDGMKLSRYKRQCMKASITEGESVLSYFVPLLRYHSRWNELNKEDFENWFSKKHVTSAGYLMRTDVKPMKRLPAAPILEDPEYSETCWQYLDMMRELCEENGATLILVKSSSVWPVWYDEWDQQISDYAKEHDLRYINFLPLNEEIGIDFETDTYDGGLHLNLYGAEKLTSYFGQILAEDYDLQGHADDKEIASDWNEKVSEFEAMKEHQLWELSEYGYLKDETLQETDGND